MCVQCMLKNRKEKNRANKNRNKTHFDEDDINNA